MAIPKTARKKTYSNPSTYINSSPLIKDPEIHSFETGGKTVTLLKLTQVDATKSERHSDLFIETFVEDEKRRAYLSLLKKGDYVMVNGKLEMRTYEKKDGTTGFAFEIRWPRVVEPLVYLNDRKNDAPAPADVDPGAPDNDQMPY